MNKQLMLFIVAVIMTFITVHGQMKISEVVTKQGDTLVGYGKIIGDVYKFKTHKQAKIQKLHFSNLAEVRIKFSEDYVGVFKYLHINDLGEGRVLEEMVTGQMNLYRLVTQHNRMNTGSGPSGFGGSGFNGVHFFSTADYYLKKEGTEVFTHITSSQFFENFKRVASQYFSDCSALVHKIENKEFKKGDLKRIVEFYNQECKK